MNYQEMNREERYFCFLLGHALLTSSLFRDRFCKLIGLPNEGLEVYPEAAWLRDYWYWQTKDKSRPEVLKKILEGAFPKGRSIEDYRSYLESLQEASRKIIRFEKPIIAAINGYALGSGYELALACDIRIAAKEAFIGSPEAKVTSSVTGGAFRLVQDLVGPGKARELLFTAEYIDGKEAERIGLVNKTVPLSKLMETAREMATKISKNSSFSISMIKRGLNMARGESSLEALMDYEVETCLACVSSKERQESLKDFEERKRE